MYSIFNVTWQELEIKTSTSLHLLNEYIIIHYLQAG